MSSQLQDLQKRVQRAEDQLTRATSVIASLQPATRWRSMVRALLAALVLVAATAMLLAAPEPSSTVRAPFRVVDENNSLIFEVTEDRAFRVYRAQSGNAGQLSQNAAALIGSATSRGDAFFTAQSGDGKTVARLGVGFGDTPQVDLRYSGNTKNLHLQVLNRIPELSIGSGKFAVVHLGQGDRDEGRLLLGDAGGRRIVQAGTTAGGVGTVHAASDAPAGAQFVAVPNSFICGGGCSK